MQGMQISEIQFVVDSYRCQVLEVDMAVQLGMET